MAPHDQHPDAIHRGDKQHLGRYRVAQRIGRPQRSVESHPRRLGNQVALEEPERDRTQSLVHNELGDDQQRHHHQESNVDFQIEEERDCRAAGPEVSFQRGENEQRQPGYQCDDSYTLAHHLQRVVGQVRPTQQLVKRATQDE